MSRIDQIQRLHSLRQGKVDGLTRDLANAKAAWAAAEDVLAQAERHVQHMRQPDKQDFDTIFFATVGLADPQSRLQAVTRTMLQNRRVLDAAWRAQGQAEDDVAAAQSDVQARVQELAAAQAQLDGVDVMLAEAARAQQAIVEERADEDALDQFSANGYGRPRWA